MYLEPNPTEEELKEQIEITEKLNEAIEQTDRSLTKITHSGFATGDDKQNYVQYAYNLWWLDFVALIECENWNWNPYIKSSTNDYWICQLNYYYNKKFINSEDYKDVYKQLDYCYNKYKYNPKLRYWPDRKINWKRCQDYVKDRFILES